jgi:Ca2+-binding RTX toxin-like protein
VAGNGSDLDFQFSGQGTAGITLRSQGADAVRITGMDAGSVDGNVVRMSYGSNGLHDGAIDYQAGGLVVGTAQADILLGGSGNDRLDGGAGNDLLRGGAGLDAFVFRSASGNDTVLDFVTGADHLVFVDSGYASAEAISQAFVQTAHGMELVMASGDRLLLSGLDRSGLLSSDILLENSMTA